MAPREPRNRIFSMKMMWKALQNGMFLPAETFLPDAEAFFLHRERRIRPRTDLFYTGTALRVNARKPRRARTDRVHTQKYPFRMQKHCFRTRSPSRGVEQHPSTRRRIRFGCRNSLSARRNLFSACGNLQFLAGGSAFGHPRHRIEFGGVLLAFVFCRLDSREEPPRPRDTELVSR